MAGLQNPNLTYEQLYEQARQSVPLLQQQGDAILDDLKKKHPGLFDDVKFEMGPMKEHDRAQKKIKGDYGGDHTKIVDLTRARFVVTNPEQVEAMRAYFKEQRDGFKVEKTKDRFANPSDTNFRDINMQARLANGHVIELRVEHEDIMKAAKHTHDPYEEVQAIERRAREEKRLLTNEEAARRQGILDIIRDTHGEPAKKAGMDSLLSDEGRARVALQEAERITQRAVNDPHYDKPSSTTVTKIEHGAGRAAGAAGIAVDLASGNYASAAVGAASEAAGSQTLARAVERTSASLAEGAVKNVAKRIPLIGAAVTAGFVLFEVGTHVMKGDGKRAAAAAAAGGAEVAGNIVGFGVGDVAREAVRETAIAVGGKDYDVEKSGLRQLGESGVALVSRFNTKAPGTPEQIAKAQTDILSQAGLSGLQKDGKPIDVAAILRDPKQGRAFIESLDKATKASTNPDSRESIEAMVKASRDFVQLEERRTTMMAAANQPVVAQAAPPQTNRTAPSSAASPA